MDTEGTVTLVIALVLLFFCLLSAIYVLDSRFSSIVFIRDILVWLVFTQDQRTKWIYIVMITRLFIDTFVGET